jgi:hypothetical protein
MNTGVHRATQGDDEGSILQANTDQNRWMVDANADALDELLAGSRQRSGDHTRRGRSR